MYNGKNKSVTLYHNTKGQGGPYFPVNGSFLVCGSIYIVGEDQCWQLDEDKFISREELEVHKIPGHSRINECRGVNGFVLSL